MSKRWQAQLQCLQEKAAQACQCLASAILPVSCHALVGQADWVGGLLGHALSKSHGNILGDCDTAWAQQDKKHMKTARPMLLHILWPLISTSNASKRINGSSVHTSSPPC